MPGPDARQPSCWMNEPTMELLKFCCGVYNLKYPFICIHLPLPLWNTVGLPDLFPVLRFSVHTFCFSFKFLRFDDVFPMIWHIIATQLLLFFLLHVMLGPQTIDKNKPRPFYGWLCDFMCVCVLVGKNVFVRLARDVFFIFSLSVCHNTGEPC